jgi:hypothetical protein
MQHDIAADKTVEQPLDKARVRADPDDNRFPERAFSTYRLQPLSEVPGKPLFQGYPCPYRPGTGGDESYLRHQRSV